MAARLLLSPIARCALAAPAGDHVVQVAGCVVRSADIEGPLVTGGVVLQADQRDTFVRTRSPPCAGGRAGAAGGG
ncbi:MAG: hypothetical protein J2P45_26135 [Candidatus Dormibacteraeota bacterium]|nr:hypothetical protein [Candidatus Dormibacteraeota bacterium]